MDFGDLAALLALFIAGASAWCARNANKIAKQDHRENADQTQAMRAEHDQIKRAYQVEAFLVVSRAIQDHYEARNRLANREQAAADDLMSEWRARRSAADADRQAAKHEEIRSSVGARFQDETTRLLGEYVRLMNSVAYLATGGEHDKGEVIPRAWVKTMWGHDLADRWVDIEAQIATRDAAAGPNPYRFLRTLGQECVDTHGGGGRPQPEAESSAEVDGR